MSLYLILKPPCKVIFIIPSLQKGKLVCLITKDSNPAMSELKALAFYFAQLLP